MLTGLLFTFVAAPVPCFAQGGGDAAQDDWTISVDHLYATPDSDGGPGTIVVVGGKITAVTPGAGSGKTKGVAATAGLVDLSARIDLNLWSVEQSREVTPEMRLANALDLWDPEWSRRAGEGVTTVLVSPPDWNVIGGMGLALKTAGAKDIESRTVKADAVLRGAMGSQPAARNHPAFGSPTDFYSRRPTTRMATEWALREALYNATAVRGGQLEAFPGSDELNAMLAGKVPFCINAWTTQDIRTSVFLLEEARKEGLGDFTLIVDAAAEAWREPQLLERVGASVILPPHPLLGRTNEGAFMSWNTARLLLDRGVTVALSSHGATDPLEQLDAQAGYAMRGGLTFAEALAAVTLTPAQMIGVDDRVGTLAVGKDADIVLWSGEPFAATSSIVAVFVDGRLVSDRR
jgi:imidazolonepropionase-like amidohydrolase